MRWMEEVLKQQKFTGTEAGFWNQSKSENPSMYPWIKSAYIVTTLSITRVPEKLFAGKDLIHSINSIHHFQRDLLRGSQICYAKRFKVEKFILEKNSFLNRPSRQRSFIQL